MNENNISLRTLHTPQCKWFVIIIDVSFVLHNLKNNLRTFFVTLKNGEKAIGY